jgi:hypothetical protein
MAKISKSEAAREREWQVNSAMSTLNDYNKLMKDRELMRDVQKKAQEQLNMVNSKLRGGDNVSKKSNSGKKMKSGGKLTTAKGGKQMLKRADGSVSQRGLWDNIRSAAKRNKAAGKPGKKPTAAMLKQERKIKAKGK